jgi:uncharacterized Zn-binding protein involved in type VI secretion
MSMVATVGDAMTPIAFTEHGGHISPNTHSGIITGSIISGSNKVFVGGKPIAIIGSTTSEIDSCCGGGTGRVLSGSNKVFINGVPIARSGDSIITHVGSTTTISGGSSNIDII